jgi:tetratricopeptide (TPR) repeat protein
VTYSPDGKWLASGSGEHSLKIWDAGTGEEVTVLEGHTQAVQAIAFCPDGKRLISTGEDATIKLWDIKTERQLLSLKDVVGSIHWSLALSPDGKRFAIACEDGIVRVYETNLRTAELWAQREGMSLVRNLFDKGVSAADARTRIRDAPFFIDEAVRQQALAMIDPYYRTLALRPALALVKQMFQEALPKDLVLQRIRTDTLLRETVKERTLDLAEHFVEDAGVLNEASWGVVRQSGLELARYGGALHQAEAACRLAPENGDYRNTLGVAQYRCGNYERALQTLEESNKRNTATKKHPDPADLAFLAMTFHRLGQKQKAQEMLALLRATMKEPWLKESRPEYIRDCQDLLGEAETLLTGKTPRSTRSPK